MTLCDTITQAAHSLLTCQETPNGARVRTTCVFPSFEPVFVYIAKVGDGFIVHDAGETVAVILAHGRDGKQAKRAIKAECKRYDLHFGKRRIALRVDAPEWLDSAIVCVANTSATAARNAIKDSVSKSESDLAETIFQLLEPRVRAGTMTKHFPYSGSSGRKYKFDIAVQGRNQLTLIDTVLPHAGSINSKYVAFADIPEDEDVKKIVAHNNDLSSEDILLLQNVAVVAGPNGVAEMVGQNGLQQ